MSKLFIIRNQHDLYLSKHQEWLDGRDRNQLYRSVHRDEAINTVFELSSRDIDLRAEIVACDADARGNPQLGEGVVPASSLTDDNTDSEIVIDPLDADGESEVAAGVDIDVNVAIHDVDSDEAVA